MLRDFDAVSSYPSAMSDENIFYPRKETGYAFNKDTNDELVEKPNNQTLTRGSAILKVKYHNPKKLIVQHLPNKEREKKNEVNCMRIGYIVDVLTSVDVQEIVKNGGRVIEIFEGVNYREIFNVPPCKKVIYLLYELRQKYKDENNDFTQLLLKLIIKILYGEQIRQDIEESFHCKSEHWMLTEYDQRVLDYQKFNYDKYFAKLKDDAGLQDKVKKVNTMPLHLGAFVLSNRKRIMNNFLQHKRDK